MYQIAYFSILLFFCCFFFCDKFYSSLVWSPFVLFCFIGNVPVIVSSLFSLYVYRSFFLIDRMQPGEETKGIFHQLHVHISLLFPRK